MLSSRLRGRSVLCVLLIVSLSIAAVHAFERTQTMEGLFSHPQDGEQKRTWPELVGLDKDEAKAALERAHPSLKVFTVGPGRAVTMDFRTDRVRIFFDEQGKVRRIPQIG